MPRKLTPPRRDVLLALDNGFLHPLIHKLPHANFIQPSRQLEVSIQPILSIQIVLDAGRGADEGEIFDEMGISMRKMQRNPAAHGITHQIYRPTSGSSDARVDLFHHALQIRIQIRAVDVLIFILDEMRHERIEISSRS